MKSILRFLPWKRTLLLSIIVLTVLVVLNFYGLYTNKFYFFKLVNYLFPILVFVHVIFLYVLQFKIKEHELTDPLMRNLEYALYFICAFYGYKLIDVILIVMSYDTYENYMIPGTFMPIGITIVLCYCILIGLTLLTFKHRKEIVGDYTFTDMNDHIDSWDN